MEALLRDLRREFLLRRGCEGHTGGMRYIYMQKHTHGVFLVKVLQHPPKRDNAEFSFHQLNKL